MMIMQNIVKEFQDMEAKQFDNAIDPENVIAYSEPVTLLSTAKMNI